MGILRGMRVLTAPNSFQILSPPGNLLQESEVDIPIPGPGEVLLRVHAAGVNRADLLQSQGHYPPPPGSSDIPGLEVVGTVEATGEGVGSISHDTRVMALVTAGGYGEFVLADARSLIIVPDQIDAIVAAGFMEAACTVWSNIVNVAHFTPGDVVVIHGGSGGVGSLAVQVVTALGGTAIATARTPERAQRCLDLGAAHAFAYGQYTDSEGTSTFADALPQLVREATDGHGADIVLDVTGASLLGANIDSLAVGGRLVIIGMQKGATGKVKLSTLLTKRASLHGTTLRSRPAEERATIVDGVRRDLMPLFAAGTIAPVIHHVWDMQEAARAHEQLLGGDVFGKLVLRPW